MMDHNTDKMKDFTKVNGDEKVLVVNSSNGGVGKILLREDTILSNIQGCAGCGKTHYTCSGVKKWSSLCWGKQSDSKYYCLMVLLSTTFLLSLVGTIFFCFTNTLNNAIISNMILKNNSLAFSMWRKPSVRPLMKVHIFNYTNWQRVRDGFDEKLHVEEVGPYVYSQEMERVNVNFEGEQLSFQERNIFRFVPEKTVGAHYDQVNVPNIPLLGVTSMALDMKLNTLSQMTLSHVLKWSNHPEPFLKLPVERFLWGYDDNIIDGAKPILSIQGRLNFDKFGLLVTKNGTGPERLTINTGETDLTKMNLIELFNGEDHTNYWSDPECNKVEGSDGMMFPPETVDRNRTLWVFFPNLCRRVPFNYEKDVEIEDGVTLLRYRMPANVFDDPKHNPYNGCYCETDTGACPPRGVINVTVCSMGAPAQVSFPHFMLGDPKLREDVTGMKPDPIQHDSYIDLHPKLGISLNGKSALQFNIQVRKHDSFSSMKYLKNGLILPVAWMDVVVEEFPEDIKSLVYHGTYSTAAVQLGLSVMSILGLIISGLGLCVLLMNKRRKPCAVIKKIAVETEIKTRQALLS